jgi:hypothetical protein
VVVQDAVDADMKKFEMDIAALEADMESRWAGTRFDSSQWFHTHGGDVSIRPLFQNGSAQAQSPQLGPAGGAEAQLASPWSETQR